MIVKVTHFLTIKSGATNYGGNIIPYKLTLHIITERGKKYVQLSQASKSHKQPL